MAAEPGQIRDKEYFLERVSREMAEDLDLPAWSLPEQLAAACRILAAEGHESGLAGQGAALVIKVQNVTGNEADFAALRASVGDLAGTVLLTETLSRADIG